MEATSESQSSILTFERLCGEFDRLTRSYRPIKDPAVGINFYQDWSQQLQVSGWTWKGWIEALGQQLMSLRVEKHALRGSKVTAEGLPRIVSDSRPTLDRAKRGSHQTASDGLQAAFTSASKRAEENRIERHVVKARLRYCYQAEKAARAEAGV